MILEKPTVQKWFTCVAESATEVTLQMKTNRKRQWQEAVGTAGAAYAGYRAAKALMGATRATSSQTVASRRSASSQSRVRSARTLRRAAAAAQQQAFRSGMRAATSRMRLRRGGRPVRAQISTKGYIGPKFPRTKKLTASDFAKRGAVYKIERGGVFDSSECAYVGHNSHPLFLTWGTVMMAFVRRVARKWGIEIVNFESAIDTGNSVGDINVDIEFRHAINGDVQIQSFAVVPTQTWKWLSNTIMDNIHAIANGATAFCEILNIQLNSRFAGDRALDKQMYYTRDLWIDLVGTSNLQIQNRTPSAAVVPSLEVDNVANNPIHGKKYYGHGQNVRFREASNVAGPTPNNFSFDFNVAEGFAALSVVTANQLSPEVEMALKKPPPGYMFERCKGTENVRMNPGVIRRSYLSKRYRMTFNELFRITFGFLRTAATAVTATEEHDSRIGIWSIYGLERLCSAQVNEPDIKLAVEVTATMSALVTYSHAAAAVPYVEIGTLT